MTLNAQEVKVASFGHIWLGDETATAPADVTTAVGTGWTELGYANSDGVTLGRSVDTEDVEAWQSAVPVRRIITGSELTIGCTLIQTNADTLGLYFGGEVDANGVLTVSSAPTLTEHQVLVEWQDGGDTFRLYVARATISDYGDVTLARGDAVGFEITWTALPPSSGTDMAKVLTPVPAEVPA